MLGLSLLAAMTMGSVTYSPTDPWIEFDKKPHLNPTSPEVGVMVATGTFKLPPGYRVGEINILYQREGAENPRNYVVVKAQFNEKEGTWVARAERVPGGLMKDKEMQAAANLSNKDVYVWVLAHARIETTPFLDGGRKSMDSRDIRRVCVLAAKPAKPQ